MKNKFNWFNLCLRYNKDIWGEVTLKHKLVHFLKSKVNVRKFKLDKPEGEKRLLDFSSKNEFLWRLNYFSFKFEVKKKFWKKKNKPLKNRMKLFFLTKVVRFFYGNISWKKFIHFCNLCLSSKYHALFWFLQIFEFWAPMFIYWSGLATSYGQASFWLEKGFIQINKKVVWNKWKIVKINDLITFSPEIWTEIKLNYVKILYYAFKSCWWRKCFTWKWSKFGSLFERAHFIPCPEYLYFDTWTFSLYWWKNPLPGSFKYYFKLNISNMLKFTTI